MLDDQLTRLQFSQHPGHAAAGIAQDIAGSVLAVLAGVPLDHAAARAGIRLADLADAVDVYKAAGYTALRAQAAGSGWYQARVQFIDWNAAECIAAAALAPALMRMENDGQAEAWWFIRKAPCWRLRLRPAPAAAAGAEAAITATLDELAATGLIRSWQETIYEPESAAFGGYLGMGIAHALFHADSRSILEYARQPAIAAAGTQTPGRRELSVLLSSALLRSAGQDWYEQADTWHQVVHMRPLPPAIPTGRLGDLAGSLRRLLTADTGPDGALFSSGGPLAGYAPWAAAFDAAGRSLDAAATAGTLERGVRGVLAHHIIFHWNRLGLTGQTQAILARAARDTIMNYSGRPSREQTTDHQ